MKTKISHLGRSTVSVILAVMMLLSTMLIGTVSTVNAANNGTATVYFKNTLNWNNVYVYFYTESYWDKDKGSGSNGGGFAGGPFKMTKVEGTDDIYSYTYTGDYSQYISFTKDRQENYGNFWSTEAVYRTDFDASKALYTPNTTSSGTYNSVNYYNNGTWTAYSGGSGGGSTEATYYLGGRVGQNLESDTWLGFTKDYQFQKTETSGLYKYVSTQTPAQWKALIGGLKQYFFVHTGSSAKWYGSAQETGLTSANQATALTEYSDNDTNTNRLLYIDSSDTSGNVTFWFDTRNSDKQLYYTVGSESSLTPVADSVTLTASSETVTSGGSTKLTATLTDKATGVDKVTYTFKKDDGTVVGTVTDSAENTASFNVDNITSDTTYTVTVSADNYKSITSNEATVTVEAKKTFYLFNSEINDIAQWPDNNGIEMKLVDGKYVAQLDLKYSDTGANHYFAINDSSNKPTKDSQLWHGKTEYSITKNVKNVTGAGPQEYNQVYYFYFAYYKLKSVTIEFDGKNSVTITDGGSTAETVKITVPTVDNAIVTADANSTTYNEGASFDIQVGSSFKVNVKGENGYTLNTITYGKQSETKTGASFTAVSDETKFSVAMNPPVSNPVTVTFGSNNETYGTVSAMKGTTSLESPAKVNVGDEVTFTAQPNQGYKFIGWKVNDESETRTEPSLSLKITADTTVTANFKVEDSGEPSGRYILWGTDASFSNYEAKELYSTNDGKYYAKFDVATDNIVKEKDCFFVFSTSNTTSGVTHGDTNVTINEVEQNKFYFKSNNSVISGSSNNTKVPKIWNGNDDLIGFKIIVSDINGKVTYSCEPTFDVAPADTVEITAKDGTIRGTTATIADLGNTTIEVTTPEGKTLKATDSFSNKAQTVKKVPDKSTVKVTTTIDESKTFAGVSGSGYYVKGFSINGIFGGVLSQSEGKSHDSDVYTFEFTVNQELYNETKLEITPVYFLKDDSNCVYFYIENYDSAKQIWGNTPSCYVYYGSGKTTLEALGYYPGQPMVDYNGSIFTQIPKSIDNGGTTPVKITGMTLNNYVWDDVHSAYNGKNQREDNAQTYDYDDFVKIAESGAADNIIYRFKYNEFNNEPADTFAASKADAAGWEVFLDYQNYPTDIFGNKIGTEKLDYKDTKSVTSKDNYLSIISDGYQNNYIGKYATAWSIYNKAGDRVATIPSSALLYALGKSDEQMTTAIASESTPTDFLPGKDKRDEYWKTFKTLYQKYKGVYAQINFEAAISGGGDYGNRLDGRWYYSQNRQEITGEIKIQYANTLDDYKVGNFKDDTFVDDEPSSIEGTTTGASAYFTDPVDKVRKLKTEADNTQDYKFVVNATSTATYTFVGWYRLIDGDYKAINPSDMSSLTGAVTRNSDVTLVARYIKTPGGSMTFQHSLYKGENAGGGKATTEIQVVVKDSEGKSLYNSGRIAGTASIDKNIIADLAVQTGLTVTVTLFTTTKNLYNFKGYYSAENTTDITAFNPTTGFTTKVSGDRTEGLITTSVYTFSFNDYYKTHQNTLIGDNAGTVYYNFYSDITSIKVPYKVQFSYTDRMGDQKYYNKAGYVDPENTSSYTIDESGNDVKVTLTDSFILTLAPYESNFTKNLTWNEIPVSNTAFDSSVTDSIASAVVNSTQSDRTIHLNVFRDKDTNKPTSYNNENGNFVLFTKKGSSELPYGSVFYTSNGDGTYTYDITAPKTYKDNQFMYWAIYSDPECKNLVIKAYNSEGHFSYVAYDNCWIVPVYGESSTPVASVKEVSTSTQFMEVTRNQWTADTNSNFAGFDADDMTSLNTAKDFIKEKGEDKLYADFVLNFFYNGKQLSVFDPNSENVKAGVLIQRLELDENETGTGYITDLDHYAKKYNKTELDAAKDDAINKINNDQSTIKSVKQQIDNSKLDNKNRLQYYTLFKNVKGNNNCVFRLYTYIQYTDASGETVVELSNPVYFTFYDIANKS